MRLEHYSTEKIKKELTEIISEYIDLSDYQLFFFGSRVRGEGSERSDIDVGIYGREAIAGAIMEKIREKIDALGILYSIDFVDFFKLSEDVRQEALKSIEEIRT